MRMLAFPEYFIPPFSAGEQTLTTVDRVCLLWYGIVWSMSFIIWLTCCNATLPCCLFSIRSIFDNRE